MIEIDGVSGLSAADLMHRHLTTIPVSATVGELRAYFDASSSHRLALVVEDGRYVGAIEPSAVAGADAGAAVTEFALRDPFVEPGAPAPEVRDLALGRPSRRVPVVTADGELLGIVAVNRRQDGFCGT